MAKTLPVLLVDKDNKDYGVADMAKVSLNPRAGFTNNHLMRLKGILGGEEIVVLIDSGTSNNVISANLVERLGIMVTDTAPFSSILANGETGLILYKQKIKEAFGHLIKKGSTLYKRKLTEAFGPLIKKGSTGKAKMVEASTESKSLARSEKEKQLKRLTKAELAEKGSKGLCLICDQKLTPGHRCATPTLQVLLVDKESFADIAKVSLSSVASHTNNPTMRLKGILGGEEIVVLIDCGASNNFISAHLVERLGITVKDTPTFSLSLSNGGTEISTN
ncbi:hypothetical protein CTI12_AA339990 [Artemisia annua]|uniref:Reverse transcriptase domain-containing protein n=1 Tax=Artemisia annua TaxID=35608 RepID=A0A2U1MUM7_ARTAN|nr:hypothetical protein CTI12_AA339990 [Artemisia annua]